MKSLLITFDFPPMISGIGTIYYYLWKQLNKENNLILAPKIKGYGQIDSKSGLNISRYFAFYHCRLLRVIVLLLKSFKLIKKERIDILICGAPVSLGFIGLIFKKMLKLPYCVFYWGGELSKYRKTKLLMLILKKVLKNADCVITCSEYSKDELKKNAIEENRIFKSLPAVDMDNFRPNLDCTDLRKQFGLENKKVLLTVSRLAKRKGIDTVINALPTVRKEFPNIAYLIVGSGKEEGYLRSLVKAKGLEADIIFVGAISHDQLAKYYNLCDIYVMPNRETQDWDNIEGFGVSFIEASACAKPVIAGASGGAGDAVCDKSTGLLVNPLDVEAVAKAIIQFLKDESYAKQVGQEGLRRIEKDFRWQIRAKALEERLNNLI